jgi:hypothetical protein
MAPPLPAPDTLVLQTSDLGSGFVPQPNATRAVTLGEEMKHEGAAAVAADRRSFIAGYLSTYAKSGDVGVVSETMTYRSAHDAQVVSTDRTALAEALRQVHGRTIAAPGGAPGRARLMFAGTIQGMTAIAYGWQHGAVLDFLLVYGPGASRSRLVALAAKQDAHLTDFSA